MSEKIVKYIVYVLSILIFITLLGVIYGIYTKISFKSSTNFNLSQNISLSLDKDQKIINMQVMDSKKILITIEADEGIKGIIYDITNKKTIQTINK